MGDLPIRPEAREAAAKAQHFCDAEDHEWDACPIQQDYRDSAEETIIAFCETEGLTVEAGYGQTEPCYRLVGPWRGTAFGDAKETADV